jgi:Endonuclease NucS C-terminal domain
MTTVLPLRDAYPFAKMKGLEQETATIQNLAGFGKRHPSLVRRAAIIDLFRRHGVLDEFLATHWPVAKTPAGETKLRRYSRIWDEYQHERGDAEDTDDVDENEGSDEEQAFAYEDDLRDYLAKNLGVLGKGLDLYREGDRDGVEYPVAGKRVDILAVDSTGDFVVIELKVSRGHERTIGQLLYYMGWVEANLAKKKRVRGIIVAKEISDELRLACKWTPQVELYEYDLQVTVRKAE